MFRKIRRTIAIFIYPELKTIQPKIRDIMNKYLTITIYDKQPVILGIIRAGKAIQNYLLR